jgi:two-component system, NarL family, sensor kinase
MIGTMRDEMKQALAELRRTVYAMRAPIIDELPLDVALSTLSQTFQKSTGISTHLSVLPGLPVIPEPYNLAFYRAAQEGLTNIQRHALAHNAWLQLKAGEQMITLTIEDDGKGLIDQVENSPGTGLLGLKERADKLGGVMRLEERPDGGTQLIFSIPLPKLGTSP